MTAQLNELSTIRAHAKCARTAAALGAVVGEVVRALSGDIEGKNPSTARHRLWSRQTNRCSGRLCLILPLNATRCSGGRQIQIAAVRNSARKRRSARQRPAFCQARRNLRLLRRTKKGQAWPGCAAIVCNG